MKRYIFLKYIISNAFAVITFAMLSSCGNGNNNGQIPPQGTSSIISVGTLYSSDTTQDTNLNNISNKALKLSASNNSYSIPIYNVSESHDLTIIKQEISNNNVWSTDTVVSNNCVNIKPNNYCIVNVSFNANAVTSSNDLNSVLTITYADKSTLTTPLSANIIAVNSGIVVGSPNIIAPNSSGFATGVITVFNSSTTDSQHIDKDFISTNTSEAIWDFTIHCNGNNSNLVEPLNSCSIIYTYKTSQNTPNDDVQVDIPITNLTTDQTNAYRTSSTQAPVPEESSPASYLAYISGDNVFVPVNGFSSLILTNTGNAALVGINANSSSPVTINTNNCANLAPNSNCVITISRNNLFNIGNITLTPINGLPSSITIQISGQTLSVSSESINFGSNIANSQIIRNLTVTNFGANALTNLTTTLTNNNSPFIIESSTCQSSLAAFTSCSINIMYKSPDVDNSQTNTLIVSTSTVGNNPLNVSLIGTSIALTAVTMTTPSTLKHVGVGTPIIVEFSNAINPNTVNTNSFKLGTSVNQGGITAQSISVAQDNKSATFIFTPNTALDVNQTYYVTVESSILDSQGYNIAKFSESFITQQESYYIFPIGLQAFVDPIGYPGSYTGSSIGGINGADTLCQSSAQCGLFGNGSICKAMMVSDSGTIRTAAPTPQNWVLESYTAYQNVGDNTPIGITGITPEGFTQQATNSRVFAFMLAETGNSPYIPPFWTGYNPDWTTGNTCSSWTSDANTGNVVRIHLNYTLTWTYQQSNCSNQNAIMCVQQAPND